MGEAILVQTSQMFMRAMRRGQGDWKVNDNSLNRIGYRLSVGKRRSGNFGRQPLSPL